MDFIYAFFTGTHWYVYVTIFFAKILEISISTLRIILVNKGYRSIAFITGMFEIFIWLFVASAVLTDLRADPLKALPYGLGFAFGVVIGSLIEEWLAFGLVAVQVICDVETSAVITQYIRDKKIGVTEVDAKGFRGERRLLMFSVNRKGVDKIIADLEKIDKKAMFIVNDIKSVRGGTVPVRRLFYKKK